jgi:hypothetical protein
MAANFQQLGFRTADATVRPRVIVGVCGQEKQGKTHFSMSAIPPSVGTTPNAAYFSCDVGEEGVVHKFTSNRNIEIFDMIVPDDWKQAEKEWERFTKAFYAMLKEPSIKTIIGDTATEWWELLRMARFGKLTQVMPFQYGPVNAEYRKLIKSAYASDKNLILLHKMRSVYINDKRTANYEQAGFGDTPYLVQVNCQVWREQTMINPETNALIQGRWHMFIKDCRQNPSLAGNDFMDDMCSFPMLARMVLPEADWSHFGW